MISLMIRVIWRSNMKIEIFEPGRMTQTGSSLLRLIQNNSMPVLDLLVRESIQNSLDAADDIGDYVSVDFMTGKFNSIELSHELEGITEGLNREFPDKEYKYIAIRDSNTVGLTGKLHHDEVTENDYGNLIKLIYDICKPQDAEGAGGSWGLGKTVYFRIGIGLVIYYSRILNEKGHYESRLAASLVEDEMDKNSLIPRRNGKSKSGIAWWGRETESNKTIPIEDENYIKKILDIFRIEPYKNKETGTIIIIPYIDSNKLLLHNQAENPDSEGKPPYWCHKLEDYLFVAIQRWYAPRLNNKYYPHGKWLRAKVNEKCITYDSMEPVFKIIQGLYNRAANKRVDFDDILLNHKTMNEPVNILKVLKSSEVGMVAFTKVDRNMLKMTPPDNKPNPYMYFNCGIQDVENNKPIITFVRKPGMIVSYETTGAWADRIDATDKQEFIVGTFVLNSSNKLSEVDISLEEYIRRSEMADHNSWNDYTLQLSHPRIVSKIQRHVNNKISKEFSAGNNIDAGARFSSGLGKLFGDMLLPPENFGKKPSCNQVRENNKKRSTKIQNHRDITLFLDEDRIKYNNRGIEIPILIITRRKVKKSSVIVAIEAEAGIINVKEWENDLGMNLPFDIVEVVLSFISYDNKDDTNHMEEFSINKTSPVRDIHGLTISLLKSDRGNYYGFIVESEQKHSYKLKLTIKLNLIKRNIRTVLNIDTNEGDN